MAQARANCFKYKWVVDLDIKGFFDNIDHEPMLKAIDQQNPPKWVRLALVRWLKVDVMHPDGSIELGESGTPQGGVISPLLANLFLHYTFDKWMKREFPTLPFERYADDAIIHCISEKQAQYVLSKLKGRMADCKLELHPEKTKIVNCYMPCYIKVSLQSNITEQVSTNENIKLTNNELSRCLKWEFCG